MGLKSRNGNRSGVLEIHGEEPSALPEDGQALEMHCCAPCTTGKHRQGPRRHSLQGRHHSGRHMKPEPALSSGLLPSPRTPCATEAALASGHGGDRPPGRRARPLSLWGGTGSDYCVTLRRSVGFSVCDFPSVSDGRNRLPYALLVRSIQSSVRAGHRGRAGPRVPGQEWELSLLSP